MKKILAAILALAAVLSIAACASEDISGSVEPNDTDAVPVGGTVTPDKPDEPETPEKPEEPEAPEVPEEPVDPSLGRIEGGTYENSFFGIGCTLDDNWTYHTEEELAKMNGTVADALTDEDLKELLKNSKSVYDMYAQADGGLVNISVIMEDVGVLYGATLEEEDYADISANLLPDALTSAGCSNIVAEKTAVEFAGSEHMGIKVKCQVTAEEVTLDLYELIVCIKEGNYFAVITCTSFIEDITDTLASCFYAVE